MERTVLIILSLLMAFHSFALAQQCTIKGEVINRDSKFLLLRKCSENFSAFRRNPEKIRIPVTKGKFNYTFTYAVTEAYELIFEDEVNSAWRAIPFFPTNGVIELKLYPMKDWDKNTVKGGALNVEYIAYQLSNKSLFDKRRNELIKIQASLSEKDEYDSPEYKEQLKQLRAAKTTEEQVPVYQKMDELNKTYARFTEKAKQLYVDPYDSLTRAELLWKYEYIKNNISPASYYLIWYDVEMRMRENTLITQLATDVFPLYEKKYPNHVYTKLIGTQIAGLHTIKTGNQYIDLKAPSLEGDTIQLSAVIRNHVALIDLWGSWCGSCIAKSRLVVPIYNQYKDKGFKVVGIAREFKSTDAVKNRLSKEQFSWLHLVDLDDKNKIWNLYGISNGVGLMVLVDKDGTILAIDPKAGDLEKILSQKLN